MNSRLKKILHVIFLNRFSWYLLKPFMLFAERLKAAKKFDEQNAEVDRLIQVAIQHLSGNSVKHGPFAGMTYSVSRPKGSSYYAKLLGSYESEIHPFIYEVLKNKYDTIVNVGCDEGFYAVGLARIFKCRTLVFDLNKTSLEGCYQLAKLNAVEHLLELHGKCKADDLMQINYGEVSLVIVDCEGDEANIFNEEVAAKMISCDLIIELHVHIHPGLVEYLTGLFEVTHEIEITNSVDDHVKAMTYKYPELEGLNYHERKFIVEERELFMQWMYLRTKAREVAGTEKITTLRQ